MPFLSPAKILVILVVALVVLGPDKLPGVAKQLGGLWGDFRRFRQRLESDVRGTFPDLPSSDRIAHAVRSPLSFLDSLADSHAAEQASPGEAPVAADATAAEGPGGGEGPPDGTARPTVPARADDRPELPAIALTERKRAVHRVRPTGVAVPDDPGMN